MDSDSNEEKYSTSEDTEDDEPRPPSWRFSISQPLSPDFSASSSEDDDDVGNVTCQQPQPWRFFFHLLDLAIVNSYILLSSSGGKKISHRDFCLILISKMLARSGHEPRPSMPVERPAPASTNIRRLDTCHNKHWPQHQAAALSCVFSEGRDANHSIQMRQVRRGTLCGPKFFWRLPHEKDL